MLHVRLTMNVIRTRERLDSVWSRCLATSVLFVIVLSSCHRSDSVTLIETSAEWLGQNSVRLAGFEIERPDGKSWGRTTLGLVLGHGKYVVADRDDAAVFLVRQHHGAREATQVTQYGQGPDELENIGSICRTESGFLIASPTLERLLFFDSDGTLIHVSSGRGHYRDIAWSSKGIVATALSLRTMPEFFPPPESLSVVLVPNDGEYTAAMEYPYDALDALGLPALPQDQLLHRWRITTCGDLAFAVAETLDGFARIDLKRDTVKYFRSVDEQRASAGIDRSLWTEGRYPVFYTDIDADDAGIVFVGHSTGMQPPDGSLQYRIDVMNTSLEPLLSIAVLNRPYRLSARYGELLVASDAGEKRSEVWVYDYSGLRLSGNS